MLWVQIAIWGAVVLAVVIAAMLLERHRRRVRARFETALDWSGSFKEFDEVLREYVLQHGGKPPWRWFARLALRGGRIVRDPNWPDTYGVVSSEGTFPTWGVRKVPRERKPDPRGPKGPPDDRPAA